jgi:hypothetical protein
MALTRHRRATARSAVSLCLAAAAVSGCFADPTEVVVVVDTDAKVGRDFIDVQLCFSSGSFGPSFESHADGSTWPVTVGARHEGGIAPTFDVLVKLNTTFAPDPCNSTFRGMQPAPPFDTRKAMDVRFVDGEMRALYLPLFRACACVDDAGMPITNCPHALDPDCHDLSNPQLADFDEDNLPHIPASAKLP